MRTSPAWNPFHLTMGSQVRMRGSRSIFQRDWMAARSSGVLARILRGCNSCFVISTRSSDDAKVVMVNSSVLVAMDLRTNGVMLSMYRMMHSRTDCSRDILIASDTDDERSASHTYSRIGPRCASSMRAPRHVGSPSSEHSSAGIGAAPRLNRILLIIAQLKNGRKTEIATGLFEKEQKVLSVLPKLYLDSRLWLLCERQHGLA